MKASPANAKIVEARETRNVRRETICHAPSKEIQVHHCEEFCRAHELDIVARYHDGVGNRADFDWTMGEATQDEPPFDFIVVYMLRNFSWSLDETILCRAKLRASGVSLVSTAESSP